MIKIFSFFFMVILLSISLYPDKENRENQVKDKIEVIEVVGNISPQKAIQTIDVVDSNFIKNFNFADLKSIISTIPGVLTLSNGYFGQSSSTFIRGASNSRFLLMVDGVKVRDGSNINGPDMSVLSSSMIEKVEIVRGPLSSIFGSDAMGGAISITTTGKKGINAEISAGSYGSFRINTSVGKKIGSLDLSLSSSLQNFNEKNENTLFKNLNFKSKVEYVKGEKFKSSLNLFFQDQDSGIPFDSFGNVSPNRRFESQSLIVSIPVESEFTNNFHIKSVLSYQKHSYKFEDSDDIWSPYYSNGSESFEWDINLDFDVSKKIIIRSGIDYFFTTIYSENSMGILVDNSPNNSFSSYTAALFDLDKIFFTALLRYDKYKGVKSRISPQIGASISATENLKLRFSWSEGFKAPLLLQKINPWGVANMDLKPEIARSNEIGIDLNLNKTLFNLTLFRTKYSGLIDWVTINPSTWQGQYQNIDSAIIKGIEAGVTILFVKNVSMGFNYTYLYTKDIRTGQPLKRRPKNSWNFTFSYSVSKFNINLDGRYVGKRPDFDYMVYPPDVNNPGFNTYNLSLNYRINKKIVLFGKMTNIFDKRYQEILGYFSSGRRFEFGIKYNR